MVYYTSSDMSLHDDKDNRSKAAGRITPRFSLYIYLRGALGLMRMPGLLCGPAGLLSSPRFPDSV